MLALSTSLLIPSSAAFGETSSTATSGPTEKANYSKEYREKLDNMKPFIEAYDKDGNLIKSYSEEEINQLRKEIIAPGIYKEPKVDGTPFSASYDANNNLISSTDKNLQNSHRAALEKVKAAGLTVFNYPAAQFSNNIWVGGGRNFYKPQSVVVDAKKKFPLIAVRVIQGNSEAGSLKIGGFLGGVNVPVGQFTKSGGNYQIQLKNLDPDGYTVYLNGGQVYY